MATVCIQVEDFDINGQPRVMVLQIRTRARLSLCAPRHSLWPRPQLAVAWCRASAAGSLHTTMMQCRHAVWLHR